MQYKAVIFDFDYTLGDSTDSVIASANFALGKMGREGAEREAIRKTIGLSLQETYTALTGDAQPEKQEEFRRYFIEEADRVMTEGSELYPEAEDMLKYLKEIQIKTAVVTTKLDYRIAGILKKYQAQEYVQMIVGVNNVANPKPDPEGTLRVLEQWNLKKEEVLYVGDSLVDARTAAASKVPFAAVTTGTTTREDFQEFGCVGVFDNLSQLQNSGLISPLGFQC